MSKRDQQRRRKEKTQVVGNPPTPLPGNAAPVSWFQGPWAWFVSAVVAALVVFLVYKWWTAPAAYDLPARVANNRSPRDFDDEEQPDPDPKAFPGHHPGAQTPPKKASDSFLDDFNQEKTDAEKGGGAALANGELEKRFQALVELNDQIQDLKKREAAPGAFAREEDQEEHDRLVRQFDDKSTALEKEVKQAVQARPEDAVPRWLTGELLLLIRGAPEAMLPHLQFAQARGLSRPRLFASLARAHMGANQFADAYRCAAQAVEKGSQDRYGWEAFKDAAVSTNQFDQVVERLDRAFPAGLPGWAKGYRQVAAELQSQWAAEQKLRLAEARANDLPRVRLVIEHRRFAKDPSGQPLTTIESTGRADVILELFENEAPNTVANFLDLVERKFYDGTRFHLAVPAFMVVGGDPNSKNEDPSRDGGGGPGYVIADECKSPSTRKLFHGSLCMFKTGQPRAAGSQFFFTLLPQPGMNGHFTVFGRILQGQDVVDRLTPGHTTPQVRGFGKLIPGDLLVRAEVIRKRPHEYRVIKE